MEKKLKIALCVLIVILLGIIALSGIYTKNGTTFEDKLPSYTLATELTGTRTTHLKVSKDTKINPEEAKTRENYIRAKQILEGRLNDMGVADYGIRGNENTGDIIIDLPDNLITDTVLSYMLYTGQFSITDTHEGTELMNRSHVKNAKVTYGSTELGGIVVYLAIDFTDEGKQKLAEITNNYKKLEDNSTEHQETVTIKMNDEEILSTSFTEPIESGELTLSLGEGMDTAAIQNYVTQAKLYSIVLNNGQMPLTYELESTDYISSNINKTTLTVIIGITIAVAVISAIYLIIKYKADGIISAISIFGSIAILLILIRITKTTVSIGTISAMLALIIINTYFINKILKQISKESEIENIKNVTYKTYIENVQPIIVLLIIAVVFSFMRGVQVFSIGMTLFYGIVSIIIGNLILMRQMLIAKHSN